MSAISSGSHHLPDRSPAMNGGDKPARRPILTPYSRPFPAFAHAQTAASSPPEPATSTSTSFPYLPTPSSTPPNRFASASTGKTQDGRDRSAGKPLTSSSPAMVQDSSPAPAPPRPKSTLSPTDSPSSFVSARSAQPVTPPPPRPSRSPFRDSSSRRPESLVGPSPNPTAGRRRSATVATVQGTQFEMFEPVPSLPTPPKSPPRLALSNMSAFVFPALRRSPPRPAKTAEDSVFRLDRPHAFPESYLAARDSLTQEQVNHLTSELAAALPSSWAQSSMSAATSPVNSDSGRNGGFESEATESAVDPEEWARQRRLSMILSGLGMVIGSASLSLAGGGALRMQDEELDREVKTKRTGSAATAQEKRQKFPLPSSESTRSYITAGLPSPSMWLEPGPRFIQEEGSASPTGDNYFESAEGEEHSWLARRASKSIPFSSPTGPTAAVRQVEKSSTTRLTTVIDTSPLVPSGSAAGISDVLQPPRAVSPEVSFGFACGGVVDEEVDAGAEADVDVEGPAGSIAQLVRRSWRFSQATEMATQGAGERLSVKPLDGDGLGFDLSLLDFIDAEPPLSPTLPNASSPSPSTRKHSSSTSPSFSDHPQFDRRSSTDSKLSRRRSTLGSSKSAKHLSALIGSGINMVRERTSSHNSQEGSVGQTGREVPQMTRRRSKTEGLISSPILARRPSVPAQSSSLAQPVRRTSSAAPIAPGHSIPPALAARRPSAPFPPPPLIRRPSSPAQAATGGPTASASARRPSAPFPPPPLVRRPSSPGPAPSSSALRTRRSSSPRPLPLSSSARATEHPPPPSPAPTLSQSPLTGRTWRSTLNDAEYAQLSLTYGPLEMRRQEVIWELCETERSFVNGLRGVIQVFTLPLRTRSGAWIQGVPVPVSRLLDWLDDIVYLHSQISAALDAARAAQFPIVLKLAEAFFPFVQRLEVHQPYLVRFEAVTRSIDEMTADLSSDFGEFVRMQSSLPECGSLSLSSFLLKPVQRLMKYPLFFKQLCDLTPSTHPDHFSTLSLLHSTDFAIRVMQEVKIREDEYEEAKVLQSRMRGLPDGFQLAARDRRLVAHGVLRRVHINDRDRGVLEMDAMARAGRRGDALRSGASTLPTLSIPTPPPRGAGGSPSLSRPESTKSTSGSSSLTYSSAPSSASPELPLMPPAPALPHSAGMGGGFPHLRPDSLISNASSTYSDDYAGPSASNQQRLIKTKAKESSVHVFVFSDLIVLATKHSDPTRIIKNAAAAAKAGAARKGGDREAKEREKEERSASVYRVLEGVGVARVLGVSDLSGKTEHEHLIEVDLLPISKGQAHFTPLSLSDTASATSLYFTIPSPSPSRSPLISSPSPGAAHFNERLRWLQAFERSYLFALRSLSFPSHLMDTFTSPSTIDRMSTASYISAGIIPKSPSEQVLEKALRSVAVQGTEEPDPAQLEREERGWWAVRLKKVRKELEGSLPSLGASASSSVGANAWMPVSKAAQLPPRKVDRRGRRQSARD
ncbi:hypothetical protein JCM11641_004231 [Rhodosporidiobolus odoratus]